MFEQVEVNSERWFDITPFKNEEFRDIQDYEGMYQVSNYGRVKSIRNNKILKTSPNTYNYFGTTLSNNGNRKQVYLHIEVAKAFIPNPLNKPTINHEDGNKKNNRIDNLSWATYSEQLNHSYKNDLRKKPLGKLNPMYKKTGKKHHKSKPIYQYDLDGNFLREWENAYEIKRQLGIAQGNINQCCLGKTRKSHNYIWKYKLEKEGKKNDKNN